MSNSLKLYVWENVLTDYTSGIMFALATSVEEARELICPGWQATEDALRDPTFRGDRSRPLGQYIGREHEDLRGEPKVFDSPVGFVVWGGG